MSVRGGTTAKHGRDHGQFGEDPAPHWAYYCIKVFADRNALDGNLPDEAIVVSTGDGKFIFEIDEDLEEYDRLVRAGLELKYVRIFLSLAGSVTVQLRRMRIGSGDVDMLSTPVSTGGARTSRGTTYVINPANAEVLDGDQIAIDTVGDGTAEGLGVNLAFGPQ